MRTFDRGVDVVMRDIDDAMVFSTRRRAFLKLFFAMESGPMPPSDSP